MIKKKKSCGDGGTGRRATLRGQCPSDVWVQIPFTAPLELSIADTKVLAIFSFLGINTANINDLQDISAINIAAEVYIAFIYKIKSLNYY